MPRKHLLVSSLLIACVTVGFQKVIADEDKLDEFRRLYGALTESDRQAAEPTAAERRCFEVLKSAGTNVEDSAEIEFYYGHFMVRFGQKDKAIEHFEKAMLAQPGSEWAEVARSALQGIQKPKIATSAKTGGRIGYVGFRISGNKVSSVFANSPAAHAGLKSGDLVVSVDRLPARGLSEESLTKRIRGPIGTTVSLIIERLGKQYTVNLTRAEADSDVSSLKF